MLKNLEFLTLSYFSSSWRIGIALKVCGIDRAVQIGRKCVFGCVNSMPRGRFMRLFMIFAGFHQFGWILENVEKTLFLKIFEKFPFVSEWDCVKKVRGVQEVNRNMPRTPLSGLRRNLPLAPPLPYPKGGSLRAWSPQSVAQGSAFGLQGGGALKCGRLIQSCS
jgi:hypothetical protein